MAKNRPVVAVISKPTILFEGRARAEQRGGFVTVIAKLDGSVVIHGLDKNTKSLFYNPAGECKWRVRGTRFYLSASSKSGDTLRVRGSVASLHRDFADDLATTREKRARVAGTETDLVDWLLEHPEELGLPSNAEPVREPHRVGGRVDLFFTDVLVEVKKNAGIPCYDQMKRYLRDAEAKRGIVACLNCSAGLRVLVDKDPTVSLVIVDGESFRNYLRERG